MGQDLYVSASAAVSRLRQLETVSNNLANVDSVGFKADRTVFHAALASSLLSPDQRPIAGAPGRVFVATGDVRTDYQAGPLLRTGAPLDVAIDGPGFFAIETPAGVRYTRAGSFAVRPDGLLSTPLGHPVLGEGGTIEIGSRPIRIGASGEVSEEGGTTLGRLRVVEFADPAALSKEGGGLFRASDLTLAHDVERPSLFQGSVEGSNVKAVRELAVMMILQRSYDAAVRMLQADDQATERLLLEVSR